MPKPKTSFAPLALLCCLLVAAPAAARPSSPSSAVVSLGDSFISGEGGRWLGNSSSRHGSHDGTDRAAYGCAGDDCEHDPALVYGDSYESGCDRSDTAPVKTSGISVDVRFNLACSGATTRNLWRASRGGEGLKDEPTQAAQLARVARSRAVRLVTVTVGANDFGFGAIVARCAVLWTATPDDDPATCHRSARRQLRERQARTLTHLRKTLREVRAVMKGAGYRGSRYRLLVVGYSSPIPAGHEFRYPQRGWSRLSRGGCPFWNSDASWAAGSGSGLINRTLRDAARREGADFLDVADSLAGHRLCERASKRVTAERLPSESGSEWVRQLDPGCCQGRVRESLHPNAYGQRELGRCIGLAYSAGRGDFSCARSAASIASSYLVRSR